ncbi:acyl-CoA dehydrogenase family protein [Nocardiopsis xinjiangensis]|uniref:acyl-CoA dehydrogenase family protein n=1 Tax=Nocardiopsis xinjiangensis TaxID=124285 RepID=UPI00034924D0|nr:acyl-CoA dehydrogenase family protein [Nocardiopsis xinjiangensis]
MKKTEDETEPLPRDIEHAGWWEAVDRARRVAAENATDVDRGARFPKEAVDALRQDRLLAAAVPVRSGGRGMDLSELVRVAELLARGCGSAAMVWAMHQIQMACLVRHHPESPLLPRAVEEQWLIASVTSEVGTGGDLRSSAAGVASTAGSPGEEASLLKQGTTVSYGEHAQGYLITARREAEADRGNQVAVLVSREQVNLVRTGGWNTLGMRGTCSPSFDLDTSFEYDQILPAPFGDIAAHTMTPFSHVLWAGVWVGLATEAFQRAVALSRKRSRGGAVTAHPSLALAHTELMGARGRLTAAVSDIQPVLERGAEPTVSSGAELNALKVGISKSVGEVVRLSMEVCGMAGFSEDGPHSVARILRDVHSAPLMIGNTRLLATNSQLLLTLRGDR